MRNLNIFKTYSGLPRSIYVVFFARIINSMECLIPCAFLGKTGTGFAVGPYMMSLFIINRAINCTWILVFILGLFASACMYILYLNERKKEV